MVGVVDSSSSNSSSTNKMATLWHSWDYGSKVTYSKLEVVVVGGGGSSQLVNITRVSQRKGSEPHRVGVGPVVAGTVLGVKPPPACGVTTTLGLPSRIVGA